MSFLIVMISMWGLLLLKGYNSQPKRYVCNTDGQWPEFMYMANGSCLRCPNTCETCLPETGDLYYPCRTCFVGYGFEPSPTARETLDNSTSGYSEIPPPPSDFFEEDDDKIKINDTDAEFDDPFTWFVSGICKDCLLIGKHPMFASSRLRLTSASQFTPYEGRLEVYYSGGWWAVCDDLWNMINTHIACSELGLGLGVSFYYEYYQMPLTVPLTPLPIAFDNVECNAEETSLFRCQRSSFLKHNCDISETLGIKCSGPRHRTICVDQCPVGQWLDSKPGVCKPCSVNCLECSGDPTGCTVCEESKYLATNSSCVIHCLPGFYGNEKSQVCEPCDESCTTCENGNVNSICSSCTFDKALYEKKCVTSCPENTFFIQYTGTTRFSSCISGCPMGYYTTSMNTCKACHHSCVTCSDVSHNCTSCPEDKLLSISNTTSDDGVHSIGVCVEYCDVGFYPNADYVCKHCKQRTCNNCYLGGEYCRACVSPFKLQFHMCVEFCQTGLFNDGGVCAEYCVDGYYGDVITGECVPCASPCKQCIERHTCTECFSGFHLDNGRCVPRCPSGYVATSLDIIPSIRLVGSRNNLEGMIQVWRNNSWAYICVESMRILYGQFLCENLGIGNVLQINHKQYSSDRISSFVYYLHPCFESLESFEACVYSTVYRICTRLVPFLRCSGQPLKFIDKCVKMNTDSCDVEPCSNVTSCHTLSVQNKTSYCENCPRGYVGDGFYCEKVLESDGKLRILFPPENIQLLNWPESLELQLPCVVNQPGLVNITWNRNGLELESDAQMRVEEFGTLTLFEPVGEPSSGLYMCMVFLHEVLVASRVYDITVQERIRIVIPPEDYTGTGHAMLNCSYDGYPPAKVTWYKDSVKIKASESPDYSVKSNGSLVILMPRPRHTGVYKCVAKNEFTQDSAAAHVNISGAPVIINKSTLIGAPLGKVLRITCEASGGPVPDIYWKKNGKDISWDDRVQFVDGNTLQIVKVDERDSGQYKCIARNVLGQDIWITNVTVMEFPSGIIEPSYAESSLNQTVHFQCRARPLWPTPSVVWYLPGRGWYEQANTTHGISIFKETIMFQNAQESDTGNVTCTISNPSGSVTVEAVLVIKVPPRFIFAPYNMTLIESWLSHIPWTVYAIPGADIKWHHPPGVRLNHKPGYHANLSGLYFRPVWPDSQGWYEMRAENSEQILPLLQSAYITVIRSYSPIIDSEISITDTTVTVPLQASHDSGDMSHPHDYADIIVTYMGNDTQFPGHIETSPFMAEVINCTNETLCSDDYNSTGSLFRVGVVSTETDTHFTIGDNNYYSFDGDQVFNPWLEENSWYGISVRYFSLKSMTDDDNSMVAAINYTYVFTRKAEIAPAPFPAWKIALPIVLILLCFAVITVVYLRRWSHKRGYSMWHTVKNSVQNCKFFWWKKEEGFDLEDGPMDVECYLPQFSPNPSPTHEHVTVRPLYAHEFMPSGSYIPTEDEIEHMLAIGINYYSDSNWISQVPEGILELSMDNLNKLKEEKLTSHINKNIVVDTVDIHTYPPTPPLRDASITNNDENLTAAHNTGDDVQTSPGINMTAENPATSGSGGHHLALSHTASAASTPDSGYNEGLPKRLSLSSKTGQNLAKEVVHIMKLRHIEHSEITSEPHITTFDNPTNLQYIKSRLLDAVQYICDQFTRVQESLRPKSKKTIKLSHDGSKIESVENFYYEKDNHSKAWGTGGVRTAGRTMEEDDYQIPPAIQRRSVSNNNIFPDSGDEEEYIDPVSIVSVPRLTQRMKDLREHNTDQPPTPKLLHVTNAMLEKVRKESLSAKKDDMSNDSLKQESVPDIATNINLSKQTGSSLNMAAIDTNYENVNKVPNNTISSNSNAYNASQTHTDKIDGNKTEQGNVDCVISLIHTGIDIDYDDVTGSEKHSMNINSVEIIKTNTSSADNRNISDVLLPDINVNQSPVKSINQREEISTAGLNVNDDGGGGGDLDTSQQLQELEGSAVMINPDVVINPVGDTSDHKTVEMLIEDFDKMSRRSGSSDVTEDKPNEDKTFKTHSTLQKNLPQSDENTLVNEASAEDIINDLYQMLTEEENISNTSVAGEKYSVRNMQHSLSITTGGFTNTENQLRSELNIEPISPSTSRHRSSSTGSTHTYAEILPAVESTMKDKQVQVSVELITVGSETGDIVHEMAIVDGSDYQEGNNKILPLNVSGKDQTETEVIETETKPQPSLPVVTAVIKAFSEEVKLLTLKTTVETENTQENSQQEDELSDSGSPLECSAHVSVKVQPSEESKKSGSISIKNEPMNSQAKDNQNHVILNKNHDRIPSVVNQDKKAETSENVKSGEASDIQDDKHKTVEYDHNETNFSGFINNGPGMSSPELNDKTEHLNQTVHINQGEELPAPTNKFVVEGSSHLVVPSQNRKRPKYVMTDTFHSKPPMKLSIPEAFKN